MNRTKWCLIILPVLIIVGSLNARELNLRQALELAQQHSFELKKAKAETEASLSSLKQAKAERLPTLTASARAAYNSFVPSMSLNIPPAVQMDREIGGNEMYQADLSMSVPIYTGGRISSAIQSATSVHDFQTALTEASLQGVLYQARLAYLQLYRAERMVEAAEASLKRARVIQGDALSMLSAGAADSMDFLESNLNLTGAKLNLTSARNLRRQQEISLLMHLGLPVSDTVVLTGLPKELARTTFAPSVMEISKPELRAADASVALSEAMIQTARAGSFPSIALFGGYSYGKPNRDFFNYEWSDNFTVGASLTWSFNLGNRTGHSVRAQRHRSLAVAGERDRLVEQIDKQVRLSRENERLAWERYLTAQEQFMLSSDNYRLATSRRKQGALSTNRLLEIEAALREAEAAKAAALADYYMARTTLYYSVGNNLLAEGF